MGLSESALKPFSFLSHCKVSCDSPCCVKICGEDNHCNINIDTHEHISDSEEEHIEIKWIIVFIEDLGGRCGGDDSPHPREGDAAHPNFEPIGAEMDY